jgi:hypothetical protein
MSPPAAAVIHRLDGTRQKWWLFTLLSTTVLAVCISFGTLMAFMLADALLRFSQLVLLGMFLAWLTVTGVLLVTVGRRLARNQRSLEAAARRVESECPELGSDLINLVQLAEDTKNQQRAFCEAAVRQAAARIGQFRFDGVAAQQPRWRRFIHCMQTPRDLAESLALLGLLMAGATACGFFIPSWGSAASRLLRPWHFVPSVGAVQIISVKPGNTEVLLGSSLEIAAQVSKPDDRPCQGVLFVRPQGEAEAALAMTPDKKQEHYQFTLPSVLKPLRYRLQIGDSQTELYSVGVREKPTIAEVEVVLHYPAYLGRQDTTFSQKHADLEAPQYTVVELKFHTSVPVAKGYVEMEAERFTGRVQRGGDLLVIEKLPLIKDATFTVHLFNDAGHTDPDPRINRVRVVPDRPPTVELLKPARQTSAAAGSDVPVVIRAGDDYGIGRLRLEMKVQQAEAEAGQAETREEEKRAADNTPPAKVEEWTAFEGSSTAVVRQCKLALRPESVKPGQTVLIRAVAWDKRQVTDWGLDLKPQQSASGWHAVRIIAPETKSAAVLEQLDGLRGEIWKILEKQLRARLRTAATAKANTLAQRSEGAGTVRAQQVEIQQRTGELVKSIGPTEGDARAVAKRILNKLAFGEMLEAVQRCDELVKISAAAEFERPAAELMATQDRIIDVLRRLLDATRQAETDVLAEMKQRAAGDLPDDARKKLQDARDKLEEFLRQQKKVIEASENLAKKPVEDFTAEEEQKLREMAASEDDWSKFMKELQTDLSKLPEQDFSNPAMAKELVEVQTELKMAEDALLKKTADIAVPLEQLSYERAEEIKTNIEKWLPDTPDRERWSQEESLTDKDKEAPMAELPGELEDLIGELMEEESDLFDEMEDVSSSAADSLDKGAGWDAMDGPISDFSAKGVTGNRLPNTSEIGGRSGEGRSGKSSGEFVGDEAVGKGGRKTPSRLTPDPYVKGQIKDHSKDPTGGATGGGKESGQGGEGLEGPQPNSPGRRDLDRLAGKQAALRNKAEGIDLQFQVMNYHHTDLKKMIEMMAQIERDLRSGRYQNAQRERKVLVDGLGNIKQYLEGEFQVRQDATANLPTDIQKEILGSMQDPSPAGWEELNRQYFERLSGTGASGHGAAPQPQAAPEHK